MVTEISPKLNLGGALGAGLGRGLQNISERYANFNDRRAEQNYQRSQLQQGLDEAYSTMTPELKAQFKPTLGVLKAFAGVPGSERALASILPTLQQASIANRVSQSRGGIQQQGEIGQQNNSQGSGMSNMLHPQQTQRQTESMSQRQPQFTGQTQPGDVPNVGKFADEVNQTVSSQTSSGGLFPRIMTPQEMEARAEAEYIASNGAIPKSTAYGQLFNQNQEVERRYKEAEDKALSANIPPSKIPEFMEMARRNFSNEPNVNAFINKALPQWQQQQQAERTLLTARTPQIGASEQNRDQTIRRAGPLLRDAAKFGKEQWAKQVFSDKFGATPLETERELRKDSIPQLQKTVEKAPKGPINKKHIDEVKNTLEKKEGNETSGVKGSVSPLWNPFASKKSDLPFADDSGFYDQLEKNNPKVIEKSNEEAAKWMVNNITDKDSLLVMRDLLMKEKGYSWKQFSDIYERARKLGFEPTASQRGETGEFTSVPPRRSLEFITGDYSQAANYLTGGQ